MDTYDLSVVVVENNMNEEAVMRNWKSGKDVPQYTTANEISNIAGLPILGTPQGLILCFASPNFDSNKYVSYAKALILHLDVLLPQSDYINFICLAFNELPPAHQTVFEQFVALLAQCGNLSTSSLASLTSQIDNETIQNSVSEALNTPAFSLPIFQTTDTPLDMLTPEEFAQMLAYRDHKLLSLISAHELVCARWTLEHYQYDCNGVNLWTTAQITLSQYVARTINEDPGRYAYFLEVLNHLLTLNCFSGIMCIFLKLNSKEFANLAANHNLDAFSELCSVEGNCRNIKAATRKLLIKKKKRLGGISYAKPSVPIVPHVSLIFSQIALTEDGNILKIKKNLFKYEKMLMIYSLIEQLELYKACDFPSIPLSIEFIQALL
ncbi:hypothetical protein PCE1_001146 [Barthelona sp. PCE]